jgi:hypothetical protein
VRFAAIASAVALGLVVAGVASGQTPKRASLTGKISVLKTKQITVHGKTKLTCRVTTTSPKLRGFALGTSAKITCVKGVLATIRKLAPPVQPGITHDSTITTSPDKGNAGATTVKPAVSVVGSSTITALGGGSITFGGALTCAVAASSPSVAAFRVGDAVDYQCASGVLTKISAAF